jgi:hypothetical protein
MSSLVPSQQAASSSGRAAVFSSSDRPSFAVTPSFPLNDGTVGPTQLNAFREFGTLPNQTNSTTFTRGNSPITYTSFNERLSPFSSNSPLYLQNALQRGVKSATGSLPSAGTQVAGTQSSQSSQPTLAPSFIGQIPYFLNAVLSTPVGALPKKPLWVVVFDFDQNLKNTIKKVKDYEPQMPEKWQIDSALEAVTTKRYQDEKGCMFAQSVTIPGEALNYSQEGITYNSFIRGGVGTGRKDFDPLRMSFLNTNVSFVDNVIRPWVVMTGHLGMVARPPSQKYRCNITVYKLGIRSVELPPYILQVYNFWEACPINVFAESLDYTDGTPVIKEAEFVYQWYTTTSIKDAGAVTRGDMQLGTSLGVTARAINPNQTTPTVERATLAGTTR